MSKVTNFTSDLARKRITAVMSLLAAKPLCEADICKRLELSVRVVDELCRHLHKDRKIYIEDYAWQERAIRAKRVPLYRSGWGVDAPAPTVRDEAYYARERLREKLVLDQPPINHLGHRDWLQVAFHGPAQTVPRMSANDLATAVIRACNQ